MMTTTNKLFDAFDITIALYNQGKGTLGDLATKTAKSLDLDEEETTTLLKMAIEDVYAKYDAKDLVVTFRNLAESSKPKSNGIDRKLMLDTLQDIIILKVVRKDF